MPAAEPVHETIEGPVRLADGSPAVIRRLTPADLDAVRRLHERLPDRDTYLRFFGISRRAAREAARLAVGEDSVAVGLFQHGELEGVANFRGAEPPDMAVAVAHPAQHHGIGTLLLEALIGLARERGVRVLTADVLATNTLMLRVLADSGLTIRREYDGPVTHLLIEVPERIEGAYAEALSRRHGEPATACAIEARRLQVDLGGRPVLRDLTFAVPTGAVTGLLGPSGCGKTTLMRCVVGAQRFDGGELRVLGLPAGSPALRSRVGYVTQSASVYTDLTGRDNVRYFASLFGVSKTAADRALVDVGLGGLADQRVGTLSGGQRARVSLACALLAEPELLVLDEPTVGQDPVLRDDLWARFHALAAAGTTLFVSSHVMDEADRCDRLLLMRQGRLVANDSPAALRATTGAHDMNQAFLRLIRRVHRRGGPLTSSWP